MDSPIEKRVREALPVFEALLQWLPEYSASSSGFKRVEAARATVQDLWNQIGPAPEASA